MEGKIQKKVIVGISYDITSEKKKVFFPGNEVAEMLKVMLNHMKLAGRNPFNPSNSKLVIEETHIEMAVT